MRSRPTLGNFIDLILPFDHRRWMYAYMATDRRINVNVRLDRDVWFKWRQLCQSNSATAERATEVLIAEKLKELGIEIRRGEFASGKFPGPGSMVRP